MISRSFNQLGQPNPNSGFQAFYMDVASRNCTGDYTPRFNSYEWHHVIPYGLRSHDIFKEGNALANLFNINDPKNCIALPNTCEESAETGASLHNGRHIKKYTDSIQDIFQEWNKDFHKGKITQSQVQQRFGLLLQTLRGALDPALASATDMQGHISLTTQDPNLGDPNRQHYKEFMPDSSQLARCTPEQQEKIASAYERAGSMIDLLKAEAVAIGEGRIKAKDLFPNTEPDALKSLFMSHPIDAETGYAIMAAGATLMGAGLAGAAITGATITGAGAGASALATGSTANSLRVIEGGLSNMNGKAIQETLKRAASVLVTAPTFESLDSSSPTPSLLTQDMQIEQRQRPAALATGR